MKAPRTANIERLNCQIRADVKAALETLAARRHEMEGGYVGLTRIINEAALLLLEREGIAVGPKPVKPATRQRRLEAAGA